MIQKLFLNKTFWLLFFILFFAAFFRLYQLGSIPAGLINDEADTGYDAYSILHTGRDQWNTFMPLVSMKGFGDYRPALYTYFVVPSESVFGLTPFAVRFPSAIFGILSVGSIYFIGKKIFSKEIGIVASFLFAVSPWSIGMSRVGIESNVAITFTILGILAFLYGKKHWWSLLIGIFCFCLALYTYSAYTLFIPLAFISVFFFWRKQIVFSKQLIVSSFVLFLLFLLPFILSHSAAHTRLSQVGFFNSEDIFGLSAVLNDKLGSCHQFVSSVLCRVALNKPELLIVTYIKNYLSHFSFEFLYLVGSSTQFAILPERGLAYIFESIFFLSGIFFVFKSKKKEGFFIFTLLLLAVIPDAITGAGHYSRATIMQPFLFLLEASGVVYLFRSCKKENFKKGFIVIIGILFLYSVTSFWIVYLSYFKVNYALFSQYVYKEVIAQITSEQKKYDVIYLSRHLNDTKQYIYYLFFNKYDPKMFQQKNDIVYTTDADGFVSINKLKNIQFVATIPTKQQVLDEKKHILLISNPIDFPKDISPVFTVKDLLGNIIFEAVDIRDLQKFYEAHPTDQNS